METIESNKKNKDIKILVADDSAFMRQYIIGFLHEGGYEDIYEAGDGEEVLEKYNKIKPDIIFLDIIMPVKDGIDVLQKLMSEKANVIMISAMGQKKIIEKAMKEGAKHFFIKPFFTARDLDIAIKEIIEI